MITQTIAEITTGKGKTGILEWYLHEKGVSDFMITVATCRDKNMP